MGVYIGWMGFMYRTFIVRHHNSPSHTLEVATGSCWPRTHPTHSVFSSLGLARLGPGPDSLGPSSRSGVLGLEFFWPNPIWLGVQLDTTHNTARPDPRHNSAQPVIQPRPTRDSAQLRPNSVARPTRSLKTLITYNFNNYNLDNILITSKLELIWN